MGYQWLNPKEGLEKVGAKCFQTASIGVKSTFRGR
jgi:hypothetical protein